MAHSIVAKTVLLLFVCLVSVGAVDWSTLTPEKLSKLPASDFTNINATELASIPAAACNGFQREQLAAIDVAAIPGFSSDQLSKVPGAQCRGFSGAQLKVLAPPLWKAFSVACMSNLRAKDMGGCTAISAAVFEQISADQVRAMHSACIEVIPPEAFNVTESNLLKVFLSITGYACEGYTPQQMKFVPKNAGYYMHPYCVGNFTMNVCAVLDPAFVSTIPANAFAFTKKCIAKMAPETFSQINGAQFGMVEDTSCAAFSPGLVHDLPARVAGALTPECLRNFTAEACAAMTFNFVQGIVSKTIPAFSADCIKLMSDDGLRGFDRFAIVRLTPQAFAAIDRLYLFSQETLLDISMEQWLNVGPNLGGITALGLAQVFLTSKDTLNEVYPMQLVAQWTNAQVSNYWQIDQFMGIVEESIKYTKIAGLLWNETKSFSDLTWMQIALLKPLSELSNIENYNPASMAGLRTDQISMLSPQSFQNFTAAQSYYFRNKTISIFNSAQVKELKPETFANMTKGFKALNPSVISSLTIAQLRAMNEKNFSEFSCDQLQQFKKEQIKALTGVAQNLFAELRSKCLSWSDPASDQPSSKLTLVEIVVIACVSGIIVIAMVIIAVVKIKKNAADRERAPLLGSEETRVNNQRKY